jgi:hypothetical protein
MTRLPSLFLLFFEAFFFFLPKVFSVASPGMLRSLALIDLLDLQAGSIYFDFLLGGAMISGNQYSDNKNVKKTSESLQIGKPRHRAVHDM